MQSIHRIIIIVAVLALAEIALVQYRLSPVSQSTPPSSNELGERESGSEGTAQSQLARREYDWERLHDPTTGRIPTGIASRELRFVRNLAQETRSEALTADEDWLSRGPNNLGGRTPALAIDLTDEKVILAGGTTSGMFRSADGGATWTKTTASNQLHSVTSVAQNTYPGKENIWYYGTGYRGPIGIFTSGSGIPGSNAFYRGDGIFKSVDGGQTWTQLPSTVSGSPDQTDPFDWVWNVDTFGEDGVVAATSSGVYTSFDGGASWDLSLSSGSDENYSSAEIAVAGNGGWYATIGGNGGPEDGLYRSTDQGATWTDVSPGGWPDSTIRTVIGVAPSNPNVVYFFTELPDGHQLLNKYEDGAGWTDLTSALPFNAQILTFGGTLMVIGVKPDDPNTVFLGTADMFRSTDGGASFEVVSGTGAGFHPDQTAVAFYPSNPKKMIVGNDGGLFTTEDNTAETSNLSLAWKSLNNSYLTTQFYTVAIDHGTPGSETVIGGTQDNGVVYTTSANPAEPWDILVGGDGAYTAVADGGEYVYYATAATFRLFRHSFPGGTWQRSEITPTDGRLGLWLTIFKLDPHDQKVMYLVSQRSIFRNSDLTAIPHQPNGSTDVNWDILENVKDNVIQAVGMSEGAPRRLYYAAAVDYYYEKLFYLENPQDGQPEPVDITGENFPHYPEVPYIGCIAVDPRNSNRLLVAFASYGVISIYATDDAGANWTPVAGNLEENPDGSGSGPSVRWISILYVDDQPVYLAGSSVGLFSTAELNGMDTKWIPEAQSTIGNVVVDMIDVRQSDGYVAVATHGNGIYTAHLSQVPTAVAAGTALPQGFQVDVAYPNPLRSTTTIGYRLPAAGHVVADVSDVAGRRIDVIDVGLQQAGSHRFVWNSGDVADGTYFVRLRTERTASVAKVVVRR